MQELKVAVIGLGYVGLPLAVAIAEKYNVLGFDINQTRVDELNSGKRREGIFGAIYWWMVKFGFAIAGLLSGLIMTLVGFNPDLATQPEGAVIGLRLFFSGFPIFGTLIAIYVMRNYDLSEERADSIKLELEKRKNETNSIVE